jgi:regulatory protein
MPSPRERKPPKPRPPLAEAGLFDYAVRALAARMRTEQELRRLMTRRAEPGDPGRAAMDAVIARLVDLNYLSDARFAADYTRIRKEGQKLGPRRIQQDLAVKGVPRELAGEAVAAAYENTDEVALAREYCARKRIQKPEDPKQSARILGRLVRAGFSPSTAFKVLRQWGVDVEEFDPE